MNSSASSTARSVADLVFVGFNSRVAALDRRTGELAWQWKSPKGSGYVAILLDGEQLLLSVLGYTYCLDAATGEELWMNPLKGFGLGVPCMASLRGGSMATSLFAQADADSSSNHSASSSS